MTRRSLTVQAFRSAAELPLFVAQDLGLFADAGIAVTVNVAAGSASQLRALETGGCDLIHTAADNVLSSRTGSQDGPCILAVLNRGLLRLVSRPDIDRIQDLHGMRLGVDAASSGYALVLWRMLASHGLTPGDYQLLEVGGTQRRAEALRDGLISATLVTPPFDLLLRRAGYHQLARAVDHLPGYLGSAVVARRSWASRYGGVADAYRAAITRATARILGGHEDDPLLEILQRRLDLDDELAAATLNAVRDPADGLLADHAVAADAMKQLEQLIELRRQADLDAPRRPPTACALEAGKEGTHGFGNHG